MDTLTEMPLHYRPQVLRWLATAGWLAVWSYICVVLLNVLGQPLGYMDESIPLVAARMVHQGLKPAVDFWTFYPPMLYYLLSGGFSVFGQTVFVPRLLAGGLYAAFLFVTAVFFRAEFPAFRSLIPWITLLMAVSIGPNISAPLWPSLALSSMSVMVYLGVRGSNASRRNWLTALAGMLAGLSLLLRINFGLYPLAVVIFDLVFVRRLSGKATTEPCYATPWRSLLIFAGGFILPNALFYGTVYGADSKIVFAQTVMAVSGIMRKFGFRKFRPIGLAVIALPATGLALKMLAVEEISFGVLTSAVTGIALAGIAVALRTNSAIVLAIPALEVGSVIFLHKFVRRFGHSEMCLLVFYACVMHYYLTRADEPHLVALWVCAAMLVPFFILSSPGPPVPGPASGEGKALVALVAASMILFALPDLQPDTDSVRIGAGRVAAAIRSPGLSDGKRFFSSQPYGPWASISESPDEAAAMRFVLSAAPANAPVFVGITRHSRGFVNDLRFYWLTDKPIVLWHTILAGETLSAPVQEGMIADLDARRIQYAVLEVAEFYGTETGYAGSTMLDEYLASHYRKVAEFRRFGVFRRKEQ